MHFLSCHICRLVLIHNFHDEMSPMYDIFDLSSLVHNLQVFHLLPSEHLHFIPQLQSHVTLHVLHIHLVVPHWNVSPHSQSPLAQAQLLWLWNSSDLLLNPEWFSESFDYFFLKIVPWHLRKCSSPALTLVFLKKNKHSESIAQQYIVPYRLHKLLDRIIM